MRWTKGKKSDVAPLGVFVFVARDPEDYMRREYGARTRYAVAKRVQGPWDGNWTPARPTFYWLNEGGGTVDGVTRWWPLPEEN